MAAAVGEASLISESAATAFATTWNETERFVHVARKLTLTLKDILKYKPVIMLIWSSWFCFHGDNIIQLSRN